MSFGVLEGKSFLQHPDNGTSAYVELHQVMNQWKQDKYNASFKDRESPKDVHKRSKKA